MKKLVQEKEVAVSNSAANSMAKRERMLPKQVITTAKNTSSIAIENEKKAGENAHKTLPSSKTEAIAAEPRENVSNCLNSDVANSQATVIDDNKPFVPSIVVTKPNTTSAAGPNATATSASDRFR